MSQTDDSTQPLRWPIAPDGYIPNSVIRGWRRKGKDLIEINCWDDVLFDGLHRVSECHSDDEEDVSSRVFWFTIDEEEEKKETDNVKDRKKKTGMEGKEKKDEKKEKEEYKMDRSALLKQTYDIQTTLQNQTKTCDDGRMNVEPQTQVGSAYNSRKIVNVLPTSCHQNVPKQLREQRETITPPLQCLSLPCTQTASSLIAKEWLKPPVEDDVISRQEDPQPQPDLGPPVCSPNRDKRLHLSSTSKNVGEQAQVACDQKAPELFKKPKNRKRNSPHTNSTMIQPELLSQPLYSKDPAQLVNTILSTNDQSNKSMPEGRTNLHIVKLAATGGLVQTSDARQLAKPVPLLQYGRVAAPLRVVQRIHMRDTSEPASSHFHYIIPMVSQQSFLTLDPCGSTQYGRLQFDWVRAHDEDELLSVSGVKI